MPSASDAGSATAARAGKGGTYAFFTGRDASRAFVTGDFTGDLRDDVSEFSDEQLAGVAHWRAFFLKVRRRCDPDPTPPPCAARSPCAPALLLALHGVSLAAASR